MNFKNVQTTARKKPPFGIAQIGKSFRNEITPGNFIFRTREFEQMEMEFFVPPDDGARWYEYWVQARYDWFIDLGIPESMLRVRPHDADELSHYSVGTSDIEFLVPVGMGRARGHRASAPTSISRSTPSSRAKTSPTSTRRTTVTTCRT